MKTTKQMIEVMQAYVDGREVESRSNKGPSVWGKTYDPIWNWNAFDYRVKKRKLYAIYDNNHTWVDTRSSAEAAERELEGIVDGYYIEFEEVIND